MINLLLLLACQGPTTTPPPTTSSAPAATEAAPAAPATKAFSNISVAALSAMEPRPFVLDVRTAEEFAQGHVPGAVNIPLQELDGRVAELEARKGESMAVICASGRRSLVASKLLNEQGFGEVMNVEGGTKAWIDAGNPVEAP